MIIFELKKRKTNGVQIQWSNNLSAFEQHLRFQALRIFFQGGRGGDKVTSPYVQSCPTPMAMRYCRRDTLHVHGQVGLRMG